MAFSAGRKTRLGLGGFTRSPTGSFAGKLPPAAPEYFFGSGMLMYSKDDKYYILNTTESTPTAS